MVNISSVRPDVPHDDACLIDCGEHPFVKRLSYVVYRRAWRVPLADLVAAVESNKMIPHRPVARELYDRICAGLKASMYASPEIKALLHWQEAI